MISVNVSVKKKNIAYVRDIMPGIAGHVPAIVIRIVTLVNT